MFNPHNKYLVRRDIWETAADDVEWAEVQFCLLLFCPCYILRETKIFLKDFIYLSGRDWERACKPGEQQAGGEAGSPLSREPDDGLDPRTLGSWPEPKADA